MKSQFAGIVLLSFVLIFVISFGHINSMVICEADQCYGPEILFDTAPSYYVDGTNGNDSTGDGLSAGTAWLTIGKAMTELSSTTDGYILNIAGGTYNEALVLSSSGTASQYNVICTYNGFVTLNASSVDYGIDINGHDYIEVDDIIVTSSAKDAVYIHNSSDTVILDNVTTSSVGSGYSAVLVDSSDNVTVTGCELTGDYYGVRIQNSSQSAKVEYNTILGGSVAGVFVTNGCDDGSIHYNVITIASCNNAIIVTNNCDTWYITNNDIKVLTAGTDGIYLDGISNPDLRNNFVIGSFSNSIVYDKNSTNFEMNYNSLRNLTAASGVKGYYAERASLDPVVSMHNNIIALADTNYGNAIFIGNTSSYWLPAYTSSVSNNLYFNGQYCGSYGGVNLPTLAAWQGTIGADYNSLRQDPLFVTSPTNDLHLQAISPCFATGTSIAGISIDIENDLRNSTKPCIGADELTSLTIPDTCSVTIFWSLSDISIEVEAGGELYFDGDTTDIELDLDSLTIDDGGLLTFTGNVLLKASTFTISGDVVLENSGAIIRSTNMTITSSGAISANGAGYSADLGDGAGESSDNGGGGAAYGGDGADGGPGVTGGNGGSADDYSIENLFYYPHLDKGSGGGSGMGTSGGAGGGVLSIEVSNTLELNGEISANGNNGGSDTATAGAAGSGGGAGGGIFVITKSFTGTGHIYANGGDGGDGYTSSNTGGGAGGGGRIAVYYKTKTFSSNNIIANAGQNGTGCSGSASNGTIEIVGLPYFSIYGDYCELEDTAVSGTFGNESINLIDLSLVTQYQVTYLQFNDDISRNFVLYYGSRNNFDSSSSPIGSANWSHSFNEKLDLSQLGSDRIVYILPSGQEIVYEEQATDYYVALPFFGDMPGISYASGYYSMNYIDGKTKTFNANGQWISYADAFSNTMTLTYTGTYPASYLTSVTLADGRIIDITYTTNPITNSKIDCITCYATFNRTNTIQSDVDFTYDGTSLEHVADNFSDIGEWAFTYSNGYLYQQKQEYSSSNFRTTVFTITSTTGECTDVTDPSGKSIEFEQSKLDHITTVKNRLGKEWQYETDTIKNVITKVIEPTSVEWEYEYDLYRRLTTFTPPEDSSNPSTNSYTECTYNDKGQILTVCTRQSSNPSVSYNYTEYEYDDYYNLVTAWGPVNNTTSKSVGSNLDKTKRVYVYSDSGSGYITSNSTNVTGTSTSFLSELQPGDTITAGLQTAEIDSITDDAHLSLKAAFTQDITTAVTFTINSESSQKHLLTEAITKNSEGNNFRTRYSYNSRGQITQTIMNFGDSEYRTYQFIYSDTTSFGDNEIMGFLETAKTSIEAANDLETSYEYYGNGSIKEVTDQTDVVTQYVRNTRGQVIKVCEAPGGLQLGSVYTRNLAGDVTCIVSGSFNSTWSLSGTGSINTSDDYTQTNYTYDANGRLKTSKNRLNLGFELTYDNEDQITEILEGELNSTPEVITYNSSINYSQVLYSYYDNGQTSQMQKLLYSSTYASTNYTYYPNGNIQFVTGPEYDTSNRMKQGYAYDYLNRVTDLSYKIDESPTYISKAITYDVFNNIYEVEDEESKVIRYDYNAFIGKITEIHEDPNGLNLQTDFEYNDFDDVTRITKASQSSNNEQLYNFFTYDDFGRLEYSYTGDEENEPWSTGVSRVKYYYDSNGRQYKKTIYDLNNNDDSVDIVTRYDSLSRIEDVCLDPQTSGLLEGRVYEYDSLNRVSSESMVKYATYSSYTSKSPTQLRKTGYEYDYAGRVQKSILNPNANSGRTDNVTTYYGYDELSNINKYVDPEQWDDGGSSGKYTKYEYDNASRLTEKIAHVKLGNDINNTDHSLLKHYYYNNDLIKQTQYTQDETYWYNIDYTYYPTGWLKSVEKPGFGDNDKYQYEYFNTGKLQRVKDEDYNELYEYIYDNAWRVTEVEAGGYSDKSFIYNDRSQIKYIKDASDETRYSLSYNSYGQISSTCDGTENVFDTPKTINYTYYNSGLRKEMETPDYKTRYDYDKAQRLISLERWDGANYDTIAEYGYNGLGQRISLKRFSSSTEVLYTEYSYLDQIGWLTLIDNMNNSTSRSPLSSNQYFESSEDDGHDLNGNVLYEKYSASDTIEYEYDDLYRLTSETRKQSGSQVHKYDFTYDLANNRTSQSRFGANSTAWEKYIDYDYNSANQLTTEYDWDSISMNYKTKQIAYSYNDQGNLIAKDIETDFQGGVNYDDYNIDYVYDNYNRITSIYRDNDQEHKVADYTFNMVGNRVMKETYNASWELVDTLKMLYDGRDCVADYDENNDLLRYYITPFKGENLIVNNANDYFYTHNGSGTVQKIYNTSQNPVNEYEDEAFGSNYGSTVVSIYNRFRFRGAEIDPETEVSDAQSVVISEALYHFSNNITYDPSTNVCYNADADNDEETEDEKLNTEINKLREDMAKRQDDEDNHHEKVREQEDLIKEYQKLIEDKKKKINQDAVDDGEDENLTGMLENCEYNIILLHIYWENMLMSLQSQINNMKRLMQVFGQLVGKGSIFSLLRQFSYVLSAFADIVSGNNYMEGIKKELAELMKQHAELRKLYEKYEKPYKEGLDNLNKAINEALLEIARLEKAHKDYWKNRERQEEELEKLYNKLFEMEKEK